MNRILLDTNAFRKLFEEDEKVVKKIFAAVEVYASPIVIGELYYGYIGGSREASNREWLQKAILILDMEVVSIDKETADVYARIKEGLRKKGKPIPTNDIWIAAQAMELGAKLVTFDGHFKEIAGLRLWEGI